MQESRVTVRPSTRQAVQARSELDVLTMQRGELQSQLQQLQARRDQLFAQSQTMSEGPPRREIQARMSEIDARSARLDAQVQGLNDQIVEAMGRLQAGGARGGPVIVDVPRPTQITIPPFESGFPIRQRGPDMRQVGGMMAAEAIVLALIGVVAWRFGMKRMRESFERMFAQQASQVTQLQQSIDTIAIEVERISEGQRYVTKMIGEGTPAGAAAAAKVPAAARRDF